MRSSYNEKPGFSVSGILKSRQEEKLAARPPKIDWAIVKVQQEQLRLKMEYDAREQRKANVWVRLKRWIVGDAR